ncbi:MAG: HDOD domain-containing protein [Pseudomonadota bacterium]
MTTDLSTFSDALSKNPLLVPESRFSDCQRALKNQKLSLSQASRLIESDPALATTVLGHVNRARANSDALEICSIVSAINLLGEGAARTLLGKVSVLEHKIREKPIVDDCLRLIDRMLHASIYCKHWAELRGDGAPSEAKLSALLKDIGELAVCTYHNDVFREIRAVASTSQVSSSFAAQKVLGFSYADLGRELG